MSTYKQCDDPVQQRKNEAMQADFASQQAMLDYVAMMADVEIPTTEEDYEVVSHSVNEGVMLLSEEETVVHSKDYEKIKKYYDTGLWNIKMVENAVVKGKITEEEFYEITGVEYTA